MQTLITDAHCLDVRAGTVTPQQNLLIARGRIQQISSSPIDAPAAKHINASGKFLMPGLCDAHVHVTAITPNFPLLETLSPFYVGVKSADILRAMLMRGFTTVRDAGGADFGLAQAAEEGVFASPRILYCGNALSQTGGHADMRTAGQMQFNGCFCCAGLGRVCDGVTQVRIAARDEIRKGATQIKIMGSGGVSSPTDRIDSTQYSIEELVAIVQEAEAANLYTMAHAYTARAINRLLECGVRTIEHGNLLDERSCELFLKHKAWLVPTTIAYEALAEEGVAAGMAAELVRKVDEVLEAGYRALEIAKRYGVPMLYGSDLLGQLHRHQLREFKIRSRFISTPDLIRMATGNAADAFQQTGDFGEIVVGARADILILNANPLADIHILTEPDIHLEVIMKAGQIYKGEATQQ